MENFNVYDMKIGDKFIFKCGNIIPDTYTAERVSSNVMCLEHHGEERFRYSYDIHTVEHYLEKGDWAIIKYPEIPDKQQNTFTKSDLISGEHIVETAEGRRYIVAGKYLIGVKGYNTLTNSYKEDLKHKNYACLDIVKVFSGGDDGFIYAGNGFKDYLNNVKLELIYDRQENEHRASQEAKLRSLEESIAEQEKEAEKLREELKL